MKDRHTNVDKYMKTKKIITMIAFVIILVSCYTAKISVQGRYLSNCHNLDYIYVNNDSTYTVKYSLGSVCDGKWSIVKDTLFLIDNWKQENLRQNNLLFNNNDANILGGNITSKLNREILQINKPMRFIIRKNKLIGIDSSKYNYNKNCIFEKIKN